ncbi:MAG: glycosyltransferase [Mycetocola sp.]
MSDARNDTAQADHSVSIVIPVYQGERTLDALLAELAEYTSEQFTPHGHSFAITEVLLVHDHGPDDSARVMRALGATYPFVRPVFLARNYGQHAASLAGMASAGGDWVVTLDEDGQHDPADIARMIDVAMTEQAAVVYARPTNRPPHGFFRNSASRGAKWTLNRLFSGVRADEFQSYRLILGNIARSVAAYAGSGAYLDVALGWVTQDVVTCPVKLRAEGDRRSGYSLSGLLSHFWRMVLSGGTRGLRIVSIAGLVFALVGLAVGVYIAVAKLVGYPTPDGWASTIIVILFGFAVTLVAMGILAEYLGVAVNMAMGRPPYLIVSDPSSGPLGRPAKAAR